MRRKNIDQGIIVKSQLKSHQGKQGQIDPQKKGKKRKKRKTKTSF
jgi:hypothetical protein